jgi:CHAD domain-containing protein
MSIENEKETDKLGPIGTTPVTHGFGPDSDLRASLLATFRAAIADAGAASRAASIDEGVHELRKALRRARATVRLVADTLTKDDRRDVSRALVEARQQLSSSRDLAVAPVALGEIALAGEHRATAAAIVEGARGAGAPAEEVRRHLQDAAARVAPLVDVIAAALPARVEWGDLVDGLADTYRRARRSLDDARRSREAFHAFRKRAKELTYQLEVLADGIEGRTEAIRRDLAGLGDELGQIVDVIMLRGLIDERRDGVDPAAVDGLLGAIDEDLAQRIKAARKRARELFDRRARRFARKVKKAVRRDHTPAAPVAQA